MLRGRGISLALDLVLNHVAAEHDWAQRARAGDPRYRAYFHLFPDRTAPDAFEQTLPEVFPDFAPGSFTWDDGAGAWVWTTFNAWQWDLNWHEPDVFCAFADLVCFLANTGVEVLRLDAIAFLWKRLGTDCQNQPEVHALTRALRAVARVAAPAVVFKAEAIVGPEQLADYLGTGRHTGKVSDLAYHNSLMVQVWSTLAARDTTLLRTALSRFGGTPPTTAWGTYLRCHDDIGWAVDDADAAAAGLSGPLHRAFLSDWYAGTFPGSDARGLVFQENAATGDRRISGTAASLLGVEAARADGDDARRDLALRRLVLAHLVVLGWGGVPLLWMGDELALVNDAAWDDDPAHAGDNRWAHRPRMPWDVGGAAARAGHRRAPGVRRAAARRPGARRAAGPARVRRDRGARPRRRRACSPPCGGTRSRRWSRCTRWAARPALLARDALPGLSLDVGAWVDALTGGRCSATSSSGPTTRCGWSADPVDGADERPQRAGDDARVHAAAPQHAPADGDLEVGRRLRLLARPGRVLGVVEDPGVDAEVGQRVHEGGDRAVAGAA